MMLQMTIREGREKFGADRTDHEITKEMTQMHVKEAFEPCHMNDLMAEEKNDTQNAIMLLK